MNEPYKTIYPILAALIVAIFPHIGNLPVWIILWCAVMWGYLPLSYKFKWPRPGRKMRRVLTAIGIIGLLLTYSRRLDQNAYLGLLAVMAALKPFEIETHRDRMITVFLSYFIVITSLFLAETLGITLYMLVSVGITTAVLVRINDPGGRFRDNFKLAAVIIAQAIPLMILLFLLFPRIESSMFGLSMTGRVKSGFSDILFPGSVSNLVESDDVAFRVLFEGRIPVAPMLYWRGIVFQDFDGRTWHAEKPIQQGHAPPEGENPVSYTVTLEPHNNHWLFALDMPAKIPPSAIFYKDCTLRNRRSIRRKMQYAMISNTRYHPVGENGWTLRKSIRLPEGVNPKTRELTARITKGVRTVDEKVNRILDYFRTGGFSYTLHPPRLGANSVDDFIFQSKQGYCEHYASAFAFMMRSIDIPARIVGGYQGGEVNPYADYLIVRQSDAHVWVEVWHPENGWYRVDPTAAVAPERITRGMQGALSPDDLPGFLGRRYLGSLSGVIEQIRFGWDAINTRWSALFEGYSYNEQKALLEKIGITSGVLAALLKALLLLLFVIGMIVGTYAWFALKPPRQKPNAVKKHYVRFCGKLSRAGFERKADQGPIDYMNRVLKNRPDLKDEIAEITDLYVRLRYRGQASRAVQKDFIQKVRVFHPGLKKR